MNERLIIAYRHFEGKKFRMAMCRRIVCASTPAIIAHPDGFYSAFLWFKYIYLTGQFNAGWFIRAELGIA